MMELDGGKAEEREKRGETNTFHVFVSVSVSSRHQEAGCHPFFV